MLRNNKIHPKTQKPKNQKTIFLFFCFSVFQFFSFSVSVLFCHYLFADEQFIYDAKGRRDPFIPLVTPDGRLIKLEQRESPEGLSLEGIIYDKQGISYAIVNGEVVKIGDIVSDYQVLKIGENKVIFIKEGEPLEIELRKEGE